MFRLKELRKENGLKRSELARILNMPASTIANYENETRQAPYDYLILFADYFSVSVDYLLGRTDDYLSNREFSTITKSPLNNKEKQLLIAYRSCSTTGKDRINEYSKIIKDNF